MTLVERSVRGLKLTEAGRNLLDHVRAMGEAATLISMVADGNSQDVTGEVTVTGTDLLSVSVLPRVLWPLREAAPGVRVRILTSSELENLTERDADIAIRHVRPQQPDLIARHLGDFRANLFATSEYLDRAGRPESLRDIADFDFVGNADPERLMAPLHNMGIPVRPESFVMSSANGVVAWELVKAGYGVSMLPEALADAEPTLNGLLPTSRRLSFRSGLSRTGNCRQAGVSASCSTHWPEGLRNALRDNWGRTLRPRSPRPVRGPWRFPKRPRPKRDPAGSVWTRGAEQIDIAPLSSARFAGSDQAMR